jgi:bifunctional DNA-binding transcriptional regulator/antitoxin component of YhaV-PrlF toxin-antitoxin module
MKKPKKLNNTPPLHRTVKGMMDRFVMGSAKVGARGQIVLPLNVRKAFDIVPGETLIVMSRPGPGGHAITLMKSSSLARMLEHIEETGERIRDLVKAQGAGREPVGAAKRAPAGKGRKGRL